MIRACSSKTLIKLPNCTSLTLEKWKQQPSYVKSLVKHVGLEPIESNQRIEPQGWFKGFNQLNSFSLNKSTYCPSLELFSEVLQIKTLKTLYLDCYNAYFPKFVLPELYNQIEAHSVSK